MKKIFTLMLTLACALFVGVACTPDNGEGNETPKAVVFENPGVLSADGGSVNVNYTLTNEVLGTQLVLGEPTAAWLTVELPEEGNYVVLSFAKNLSSPNSPAREASFTATYGENDPVTVTVKQAASTEVSFEIAWDEETLTHNYGAFTIKSEAKPEMLYLVTSSSELGDFMVQGETIEEKMTNFKQVLLENWMIMTEPDGYFVFAGNMEMPKEVYRATAMDIDIYAVGIAIDPEKTETDSSGTYALEADFATPIHVWKAPLRPFPTIVVSGELQKSVSSAAGSLVVDVNVEQQVETPQLQIRADRERLAYHGITMSEFNSFVEASFPGKKVGSVYEEERSFDLIIRLNKDYTESVDGVKRALIDTPDGKVALESVADVVSVGGPGSISRENVQRKVVVSANIASGDVAGTVERVASYLEDELKLGEGYRLEYGGQFESAESASRTLWLTTLVAILVVFVLLYTEFKSLLLSAVVLLNLPLALIGGVLATYFTSAVMSIPAIIGLITLFGIATRNGILLVSRYQHLRAEGIALEDVIVKGSADRLTPILMTAFTSALALVPMIINGSASGNEIQSPMAVVVLGGLLSSTLLNIFVVPAVYRWVVRKGWV